MTFNNIITLEPHPKYKDDEIIPDTKAVTAVLLSTVLAYDLWFM